MSILKGSTSIWITRDKPSPYYISYAIREKEGIIGINGGMYKLRMADIGADTKDFSSNDCVHILNSFALMILYNKVPDWSQASLGQHLINCLQAEQVHIPRKQKEILIHLDKVVDKEPWEILSNPSFLLETLGTLYFLKLCKLI